LGSTNTKDKRGGGGGGGRRGPHNATNKRPFLKSAAAHTAALVFCRQHTKESHRLFLNPTQVERLVLFLKGTACMNNNKAKETIIPN